MRRSLFGLVVLILVLICGKIFAVSDCSSINPIIASGTYTLTDDLVGAPNSNSGLANSCIEINASNVLLDCQGHNLTENGTGGTTVGILIYGSATNVTVQNCINVSNYTYGFGTASNRSYFYNNSVYNSTNGFYIASNDDIFDGNNVTHVENIYSQDGFVVSGRNGESYSNITFTSNNLFSIGRSGFNITNATNIGISHNKYENYIGLNNNDKIGIYVENSSNLAIDDNDITDYSSGWIKNKPYTYGIEILSSNYTNTAKNRIRYEYTAIEYRDMSMFNNIHENTASNGSIGIIFGTSSGKSSLGTNSSYNNITYNNFTQNISVGIMFSGNNTNVSHNIVDNSALGITSIFVDRSYIEDNIVSNSYFLGVWLLATNKTVVRNNNITNNSLNLSYDTGNGEITTPTDEELAAGIMIFYGTNDSISNNQILNNTYRGISGLNSTEINIDSNRVDYANRFTVYLSNVTEARITNNDISNSSFAGILTKIGNNTYIFNNTIMDNDRTNGTFNITDIDLGDTNQYYYSAISVLVEYNATISNNTINNDSLGGITFIRANHSLIEGNTISNIYGTSYANGIFLSGDEFSLNNNRIYNVTHSPALGGNCIDIFGANNTNVTNSILYNCGTGIGMDNTPGTLRLDNISAISNYFGVTDLGATKFNITNSLAVNNSVLGFGIFGGGAGSQVYLANLTSNGNNVLGDTLDLSEMLGPEFASFNLGGISIIGTTNVVAQNITSFNDHIIGLQIILANNTSISGLHVYNNSGKDIEIRTNSTEQFQYSITNAIFDNPNGGFVNFTNISINDNVGAGERYTFSWNQLPAALPTQYISFANKYLNITNNTPISIDNLSWNWLDSELSGYNEGQFSLWKYNASGWNLLNDTPNTATNKLQLNDQSSFSVFALLTNTSNSQTEVPPIDNNPRPRLSIDMKTSCLENIITISSSNGNRVHNAQVYVDDSYIGLSNEEGNAYFSGCGKNVTISAGSDSYRIRYQDFELISCQMCIKNTTENTTTPTNNSTNNTQIIPQCKVNSDCPDTEYCNQGKCTEITGQCGYSKNHQFVRYECGNEVGCPVCGENKSCVNRKCTLDDKPIILTCPQSTNIGQEARCKIEDICTGNCTAIIIDPENYTITTNVTGKDEFLLPFARGGRHIVELFRGGKLIQQAYVDSILPTESNQTIGQSQNEKPATSLNVLINFLWLLILIAIIIILWLYWRSRKSEK